jgi:hypothetical protein
LAKGNIWYTFDLIVTLCLAISGVDGKNAKKPGKSHCRAFWGLPENTDRRY